ncbi:MAG: SpoIIE family protein phosphatase [Synechococcaceae cyanobacterium SM2_3_1]|nr:SpoIIE family protein phosphatase [Synechococcaceae cyanobacterium SM2_3_1]
MQDLFGALAFALRSFKNLNQVLELIAFVASHLTDADGGALILFQPNGRIVLEQLHWVDMDVREEIRSRIEKALHQISLSTLIKTSPEVATPITYSLASPTQGDTRLQSTWLSFEQAAGVEEVLDSTLHQVLGEKMQLYGTPLLIRNTVRGRLYIFTQQSDYLWNDARQQLLRLIADQAAVAIENDELTVALRRRVALEKELEIGSEIQAQLLPRQYPCVQGITLSARCQAASQVGGDYYDFIRIPCPPDDPGQEESQRLAIVIGDVMGKGVPAGLLMTMTRGMLRAEVLNYHSPSRILQHLNQVMFNDLDNSNRFISLFYSDYDPSTRRLCFSNAAHNPTLLWSAKTESITPLDTAGPLIGLDPNSTYEERCVQLHPGDVVVYYTDGFTEAANSRGERLETSGLEAAVQIASQQFQDPHDILQSLFQQVENFRQEAAPENTRQRKRIPAHFIEELGDYTDFHWQDYPGQLRSSADDMTLVVLKVSQEN